ncbi:MAG: hypothetical protein RMJ19_05715 [Gemmatales bacterium]|nr:hypothetical protein [Gemmatales bacterium]MDW8175149.1 hypothetical protein [Gemmatales bacterium]
MSRIRTPCHLSKNDFILLQSRFTIITLLAWSCWLYGYVFHLGARAEGRKEPLVSPQFLFFSDLKCLADPQGKKLYGIGYEYMWDKSKPADQATLGPVKNILTCWNLDTGQCEQVKVSVGRWLAFQAISPDGSKMLLSSVDIDQVLKLQKELGEKAQIAMLGEKTLLISAPDLQTVHCWDCPVVAREDVWKEFMFFVGNQRVASLIVHSQDRKRQSGYTLSFWNLEGQSREEARVPLPGLDNYLVLRVEVAGPQGLVMLACESNPDAAGKAAYYLLRYDLRQRMVSCSTRLGEVQQEALGLVGNPPAVSVVGWDRDRNRALIEVEDSVQLWEFGKRIAIIAPPRDFRQEVVPVARIAADGKYVAFVSTRVVLYDVEKKEYRVVDTRIEDIIQAWENPPPFSDLSMVVNHPMLAPLMPIAKKMMRWRYVEFLGNGERLVGVTTYGKAVVWDVKRGKILTSFRMAETGLDEKLQRILGLD